MSIQIKSKTIKKIKYNNKTILTIYHGNQKIYSDFVTLTINPTPSNATVTLTAPGYTQTGNSITVSSDTVVTYTISRTGYATQAGTYRVIKTETLNKTLDKNNYTLMIITSPTDATVHFNTGIIDNHSCTVPYNTAVTYWAEKTGYINSTPQTIIVTENTNQSIALARDEYTLTVNTIPSDATVTFSTGTVSGKTCTVPYNTQVTYTVSRNGLTTQAYVITITENITKGVTLSYPTDTILFESATPGTYNFTPLVPISSCGIYCVGGGAGGACAHSQAMNAGGTYFGMAVAGGGSGGYSYNIYSLDTSTRSITVGAGGTGVVNHYSSSVGGSFSSTGNNGGNSSVSNLNLAIAYGGNGGVCTANAAVSGQKHSASATAGTGGTGNTTNGNPGGKKTYNDNTSWTGDISCSGGTSVYNGYGAGGGAYSKGGRNDRDAAYDGSAGYVKIVVIIP